MQRAKKAPLFVLIALLFAPNPLFFVGERGDTYLPFMITPPPIVWGLLKLIKEIYSIDKENMILQKNAKLKNLAGMRDVS